MNQKLFSRDFTLVAIGQIISLFGNAALCFVLPLYLLNQTGSGALYGTVTACAFIPSVLFSPIGGIIADRVNKRNIMVALDFSTAALLAGFCLLMGHVNLVLLLTATMMILYGIAGAYRPSVQASIPALTSPGQLMQANSVINSISSLASLLGPVLGGILYSSFGLKPVLAVCILCFTLSAVMEIFIRIPFTKQEGKERILDIVRTDFGRSLRFLYKEKPVIGKSLLVVSAINFFLSAMLVVGLPYLITEVLPFPEDLANRLCGFAEGALAAGGLAGGICAGVFAGRFSVQKTGNLLIACAAFLFPMGLTVLLSPDAWFTYSVIAVCCFLLMGLSSIFSIQVLSFVQAETPAGLIGKVISVIMTVSMSVQPLGCAMYGILFEMCNGFEAAVILFSAGASLAVSVFAKNIFKGLTL